MRSFRRYISIAWSIFGFFLVTDSTVPTTFAQELTPRVCIGYNPEKQNWELVGEQAIHRQEDHCPKDYAFMRVAWVPGQPHGGKSVAVRGTCCPLPVGILTDTHYWESEHCPANTVATGSRAEMQVEYDKNGDWHYAVKKWENITHYLRCTKVDTRRFQVGPLAETLSIGFSFDLDRLLLSTGYTNESRIPIGIRYGVTREGLYRLDSGGCIGYPWGSLLTGKLHKFCGFEFRSIEYKGIPGDPPRGTPVKVVPDCISLDDPLSPTPKCITR